MRILALLAIAYSVSAHATPVAGPLTPKVIAARVLAAVDDGAATDRPVYARADQKVTLYAAVQIAGGAWFTDAPKWPHAQPLDKAPAVTIAWQRVEPSEASYSNEDATGFHFTAIEYDTTAIDNVLTMD